MTTLREAAQQALEFVTSEVWGTTPYMDVRVYEDAAKLRDALRAALVEPQEPVAWVWNPVSEAWERVRAFGQWQCGAIYAFGPTAPAALAEPVQEPVAWIYADPDKPGLKFLEWREDAFNYEGEWIKTPLYAAPPQSKP